MSWAGRWKGRLRRQRNLLFPDAYTLRYRRWMRDHLTVRRRAYQHVSIPPGLFSILTAVWDGSPVEYLLILWRSIAAQNAGGACQWVVIDNGCSRPHLRELLTQIATETWVHVVRFEQNAGISRGLHAALEAATHRYVLPVDADDELYPDALAVVADWVKRNGCPPLLYTDEDKISENRIFEPYFKPDWDPVLLANSAYCAHMGVMDREKALELGVYTDPAVEGSVDWDAFLRFLSAGYSGVHIPEIVYRWRIHSESTADDDATKTFIGHSQQRALERFLGSRQCSEHFYVEPSGLFAGGAHFRIRRRNMDAQPLALVLLGDGAGPFAEYQQRTETRLPSGARLRDLPSINAEIVCLMDTSIQPDDLGWPWEMIGLFELFSDGAIVGGRLRDHDGRIIEADLHFGFGDACESPNRGRHLNDPGYFGQMRKQRTVGAVSSRWLAIRGPLFTKWLTELEVSTQVSAAGPWLGALAAREGKRVIYSPYVSGVAASHRQDPDRNQFRKQFSDLIPDRRYYPEPFSLRRGYVIE